MVSRFVLTWFNNVAWTPAAVFISRCCRALPAMASPAYSSRTDLRETSLMFGLLRAVLTGYSPEGGPLTLPLRFPRTFDEEWLHHVKRICIGADGSVIQSGDIAYVLSIRDERNRVLTIDYFHGYYEALMVSPPFWSKGHIITIASTSQGT